MKKITRKQALANIQYTFDDFFKTYFRASKEAIDETIDNTVFSGQKEKLKEAVYSAEYRAVLEQLDGESFRRYYEKVGEFAMAYEIDTRLFTDCTPAVVGDINEVLPECANIGEKLDLINGFSDKELKSEQLIFETKSQLLSDILDDFVVNAKEETGILKVINSFSDEEKTMFLNYLMANGAAQLHRMLSKVDDECKIRLLEYFDENFGAKKANEKTAASVARGKKYSVKFKKSVISLETYDFDIATLKKECVSLYTLLPFSKVSYYYEKEKRTIVIPAIMLTDSKFEQALYEKHYKENEIVTDANRDELFMEFVIHYLPEGFFKELVTLQQIITSIVIVALNIFTGGAVSALLGSLSAFGIIMDGMQCISALQMIIDGYNFYQNATTVKELKHAAKTMAYGIAKFGVNIVSILATAWSKHNAGKKVIVTNPQKFQYKHNPCDNPKVLQDAIVDENAVYGFSPNPKATSRIRGFANSDLYDWSNPDRVKVYRERRIQYHKENDNIDQLIIEMQKNKKSIEEIARAANAKRNQNRLNDYLKRNDFEGLERVKKSNLMKYGEELGMKAEDALKKYGTWENVIEKTKSANPGMDACCGLYDEYYDLYNISEEILND